MFLIKSLGHALPGWALANEIPPEALEMGVFNKQAKWQKELWSTKMKKF